MKSHFGNKRTKVFHALRAKNDSCSVAEMDKSNVVKFGTAREAKKAGYKPCKRCVEKRVRMMDDRYIDGYDADEV